MKFRDTFAFKIACVLFGAISAFGVCFIAWDLLSSGFAPKNSCGKDVGLGGALISMAMFAFYAYLCWGEIRNQTKNG